MATIATTRKRMRIGRAWLVTTGLLVVLLIGTGTFLLRGNAQSAAQTATPGWQTIAATSGAIAASVSATGNVEPRAEVALQFTVDGTITEVLVKPGDTVQAGQALARIDASDLQLNLEKAQADLKEAEAAYQDLLDGASPEEIAKAKAELERARGQYQQVAGSVTEADITAARAKLEQAQAQLAELQGGPKETDLRSAEAQLREWETRLAAERDRLSLAKTNAEFDLQQKVNALVDVQSRYSTALQNWEYVKETGNDPITPEQPDGQGDTKPNKLNDAQRQQYYDEFVRAEAALHNAESAVQQAQVALEQARQAEIVGIQQAEQQLAQQQINYDKVRADPEADDLAQARAAVASARAELDRLLGANRSGDLTAARAGIESANAAFAELTANPSSSELAKAEAALVRAQVAAKQAERDLAQATLQAPFAGTVARVDLQVGEQVNQDTSITIADLSSYHLDVPVDELDVVQIREEQKVRIVLDALPDQAIAGTVTNIEPLAVKSDKGTNTYNVSVALDANQAPVRSGMTATVEIITHSKDNAVLVPRRAVQSENGESFVLIPTAGEPDQQTGAPASERRGVTLGLSNGEFVEITDGLEPGEQILVQDVVSTWNPMGG